MLMEHPFGFVGQLLPSVAWAGARFHAVVRPDWAEIARRDRFGLGAVCDYPLLAAVSTIPQGIEIPWNAIDPVLVPTLDCAPEGIVRVSESGVRVELKPALCLSGVFTVTRHWSAMDRVGVMATAAQTGVVIRHRPRLLRDAIDRASKFGLGLGVLREDGIRTLVRPTRRGRPSVVRNYFFERLYQLWRQKTGTPRTLHQDSSCFEAGSGK